MEHIASAQNSRIKHLAKLAASAAKRRAFGQTLLEGTHLLEAFLNAGGRPECVYVAENRLEDAEISALLQRMPSEKRVQTAFERQERQWDAENFGLPWQQQALSAVWSALC